MKNHIVTILLLLLIIIAEVIFITGYKENKNSKTSAITVGKTLNLDRATSLLLDTFFYENTNTKLVYFIPESWDYNKTKSELKYIQTNLMEFKTKNYVWIVSNSEFSNYNLQNLASQCRFNFLHLPNLKIENYQIKSEPILFMLTSDYTAINLYPISEMDFMDIETYIKSFLQLNKI